MSVAHFHKRRLLFVAALRSVLAAIRELAAGRQRGGVRHHAVDGREPLGVSLKAGHGVEQALGVGVQDLLVHLPQGAVFYHFAGVNDGHAVAVLGHHAQIVGDEQHGRVVLPL